MKDFSYNNYLEDLEKRNFYLKRIKMLKYPTLICLIFNICLTIAIWFVSNIFLKLLFLFFFIIFLSLGIYAYVLFKKILKIEDKYKKS